MESNLRKTKNELEEANFEIEVLNKKITNFSKSQGNVSKFFIKSIIFVYSSTLRTNLKLLGIWPI